MSASASHVLGLTTSFLAVILLSTVYKIRDLRVLIWICCPLKVEHLRDAEEPLKTNTNSKFPSQDQVTLDYRRLFLAKHAS